MNYKSRKVSKPSMEIIGDAIRRSTKSITSDQNIRVKDLPFDGKLPSVSENFLDDDELIDEQLLLSFRGDEQGESSTMALGSKIPRSQIKVIMSPQPSSMLSLCNSEMSVAGGLVLPRLNVQAAHPLEMELKALLKKFKLTKREMAVNEKSLFTLAGQAQMLVAQITKETGKEIPVDNDLCELLSFAGTESRDNDLAIDLAMYKDILNEIDGSWRNLIYDIVGCKKEPLKPNEDVKKWEKRMGLPPNVSKFLTGVRENVYQQRRFLFAKLAKDFAGFEDSTKVLADQLRAKTDQLNALKGVESEAKTEEGRFMKTCETFTQELASKNKEIEELNKDLDEVEALNKEVQEKLDRQENEYKESLAFLTKELELACEKAMEAQKQYEDIREKLVYIQMREENLRKWPIESIPAEVQELLHNMKGKITGPERSSIDALVRIIEDLEAKIGAFQETEKQVEQHAKDLHAWEEELCSREDVLSAQKKLLGVRDQLLSIVENRQDMRSEVAEGVCDLIRAKSHDVKEILSCLRKSDAPGPSRVKISAQRTRP